MDYSKIFKEKAIEKFGNKLDFSKTNYINKRTKITVTCPVHGDFEISPPNLLKSEYGCPKCGQKNGGIFNENAARDGCIFCISALFIKNSLFIDMSSLLKEIIDRIEYEHLIEEGKDPVEVLHYKFQHIPSDIIDSVIAIDPTKKKSYSQWLLSKWDDEKDVIIDGLKSGRIAKLFQHYKEHQDIQIKDCPSVEEGLRMFVPEEDTVLTKSSNPTTILMNNGWTEEVPSELANDFDVVFNEDDWIIAVPNTYEADCKLGENMYWCTAGGRTDFEGGRRYYNHYLSEYGGRYYVNFDMSRGESRLGKDYPFTRYQFHFESNQFMDKEDDPVELDSIGLPDSAKEFYSSEGYDTSQFENLEAKIERYEQQRWEYEYGLNNDLYLNIAYDDEYEFTEPDAETDFYLYDTNDDRDPICWDEIPNPHYYGDAIIINENGFIVLKKKYGEDNSVLAVKDTGRRWRWEETVLNQYIKLPDNWGIFGVDSDSHFRVISNEIDDYYEKMTVKSCESMFVNEQCTKVYNAENEENIFIETVCDGYHSLFNVSVSPEMGDELICVVHRDVPINGEYFTINEQGLVEGEFRNYVVYYDSQDSSPQYDLEAKLPTGDYLVSVEEMGGYGNTKREYNILKRENRQILIETWFDKYLGHTRHLYGIEKKEKIGMFSALNGQQVGRWYDSYSGIDQEKDILMGRIGPKDYPSEVDIINGTQGRVTAVFRHVISRKPANNKVVILDNDGISKVFDYVENRFYFPELSGFLRVDEYEHPYLFACSIKNTEEKALFDLSSENVLVRGIKSFSRFNRYDTNYLKLEKMDGKYNIFDTNKQIEMLQNDADDITGMNTYLQVIVYRINGKYYPLNYKTNSIMINPNGISVPTFVNNSEYIYCSSDNYNIYFVPDNESKNFKFYKWQSKNKYNDYGTNFDPMHTPQEVLNMYNLIFGQQESITRNFKNYVNRINEAMKHRYTDLID